jgi:magnesium-transporting ATPase (P-type)
MSTDELEGKVQQRQQQQRSDLQVQVQQAQLSEPQLQQDTGSEHVPDSISSSSSRRSRHEFLITAGQLRGMVQAAVDSSQAAAADEVIADVTAKVLQAKQQRRERRAAKHAAAAAAAGGDQQEASSSSNGAAAPMSSNGSKPQQQQLALPALLAAALGTDLQRGLSGDSADAAARMSAFGSNSLAATATSSFWQLLLEAASDSTLLLLTAAGAVSLGLAGFTGKEAVDFIDGAAILASVAICANVTAVTNYQKEEKFRSLNRLKENAPVRGLMQR